MKGASDVDENEPKAFNELRRDMDDTAAQLSRSPGVTDIDDGLMTLSVALILKTVRFLKH